MSTFTGPRWEGFFDNPENPKHPTRVLDAIKIARHRFNRDRWRGNSRGWRKVVRNVKMMCEKHGNTLKDFGL
jgi:hypothetical protein